MSKRICVWGSSIGQGYYDFKNGGWCHLLKMDFWRKAGSDLEVINLSINGNTSKDVLDRFSAEYNARKPKVVVIAIGMNDSVFDKSIDRNWILPKETSDNLQKIINIVKDYKNEIVFIGLTKINEDMLMPVPWNKNLFYKREDVKKYDSLIKEIAKNNNVPYCYIYDLLKNEDLDDGLHPNAQGHEKMFERIRDFLIEEKIV